MLIDRKNSKTIDSMDRTFLDVEYNLISLTDRSRKQSLTLKLN
jgi:hypothetical protein